jgi:hypothetical protein
MSKFIGLLAILYICLSIGLPICKFSGIINMSWGLVLCPLWIPIVLIYAAIILVFVGMLINK